MNRRISYRIKIQINEIGTIMQTNVVIDDDLMDEALNPYIVNNITKELFGQMKRDERRQEKFLPDFTFMDSSNKAKI